MRRQPHPRFAQSQQFRAMKIGQISKHYFPITGGQQTYIQNLIDVFAKNNIESNIFQPYAPGAQERDNVTVTSPFSILHRLDRFVQNNRFVQNISWSFFNLELRMFKKKISEQDILICHYSFHYNAVKWHKKVIVLSHGVLWSSRIRTRFDKTLRKLDMSLKMNNQICIVANDTDFIRRIGVDVEEGKGYFEEIKKNIWFIPNCIDDTFFCPDSTIEKEKVLLVPRNIREDRGIDLAIEAFGLFKEKFPEYKLKIVGGPTKGKYFEHCVALISFLNLSSSITFVGSCDWRLMRDHYRSATLTIIPSLEKEGTSLSALESMGCGTPVVGTNVAGLRDLPIVKADPDPKALSMKLVEALQNLDALALQQMNSVRTIFNIRNWEKAWMEVVTKTYKK